MTRMTSSEAFVETLVGAGRHPRVRHRRLGLHGRARHLPGRRHPLHLGGARAGRRAHGRRLLPRVRPPRRVHRPERPRHHQLRDRHRRRLLGAQPGGDDHARDRLEHARAWAASRRPSSCRSSRRSPSTRSTARSRRGSPSCCRAASTMPCSSAGPTQFNIPRDLFYGEVDFTIPRPIRVERGPGGPDSLDAAAELLAGRQVPGDRRPAAASSCRTGSPTWSRWPSSCSARWSAPTCTMTASRGATRSGRARSATRARRPR